MDKIKEKLKFARERIMILENELKKGLIAKLENWEYLNYFKRLLNHILMLLQFSLKTKI